MPCFFKTLHRLLTYIHCDNFKIIPTTVQRFFAEQMKLFGLQQDFLQPRYDAPALHFADAVSHAYGQELRYSR